MAALQTEVTKTEFGVVPGQGSVDKFQLKSQNVTLEVISLGCIITSLKTKNKRGEFDDIVLGFDNLEEYLSNPACFGAVVGRVANRIAKGKFTVDGKEYQLAINNGPNSLHGGLKGFNKAIWTSEVLLSGVRFCLTSPDGDEGYPGELRASVTYVLEGEVLSIHYKAETNKTTPVNLTNHSYFNLAGHGTPDIYDHEVSITADAYLPVDDTMIPTGVLPVLVRLPGVLPVPVQCPGEIAPVQDSLFDLRKPVLIGQRLKELAEPGFDHNFCLSSPGDPWLVRHCARYGEEVGAQDHHLSSSRMTTPAQETGTSRVTHPGSGRVLDVHTSQPGVQFYTANFLDGSLRGKAAAAYPRHSAFCLETQNWPDAVNQPRFPDALLRPREEYSHTTLFRFSVG
ncbi:GALM epimerase, partial [Atractosteus spatula]|nr:GALM epimerase [Atractosteus spatula]